MMRMMLVAGARPNFVKIAPLMRAIAGNDDIEALLVHTGQHYDRAMSDAFFNDLEIRRPDINLNVGSASHAVQTAEVMKRFEPVLLEYVPDVVVVVGDVNSTIACALTAAKLGIPVAHVEAGLRSFDRAMPEEINRVLTDHISEFLFTTEPSAQRNLRREGVPPRKVFAVGNVMVDSLLGFLEKASHSDILSRLRLAGDEAYALATLHRPASVDDAACLHSLFEAINAIGHSLPVLFPVHPRTRAQIEKHAVEVDAGVRLIEPLGYLDFLRLMSKARLVLTDSGGLQEETTVLGVPCLTLRQNTERPITITRGTNCLVGSDARQILRHARSILAGRKRRGRIPHLWDGRAAERIVAILYRELSPAIRRDENRQPAFTEGASQFNLPAASPAASIDQAHEIPLPNQMPHVSLSL
jgi:UDP-N-acetylglucosamine 2-epimerase (non-hydrolysing)